MPRHGNVVAWKENAPAPHHAERFLCRSSLFSTPIPIRGWLRHASRFLGRGALVDFFIAKPKGRPPAPGRPPLDWKIARPVLIAKILKSPPPQRGAPSPAMHPQASARPDFSETCALKKKGHGAAFPPRPRPHPIRFYFYSEFPLAVGGPPPPKKPTRCICFGRKSPEVFFFPHQLFVAAGTCREGFTFVPGNVCGKSPRRMLRSGKFRKARSGGSFARRPRFFCLICPGNRHIMVRRPCLAGFWDMGGLLRRGPSVLV